MSNRATFTLDDEAHEFLLRAGGNNRSAFINDLLLKTKHMVLEQEILKANREEAGDADYHKDLAAWDKTLTDGLSE